MRRRVSTRLGWRLGGSTTASTHPVSTRLGWRLGGSTTGGRLNDRRLDMPKPGGPRWGRRAGEEAAGLAVRRVRAAARAELLQFHPVRVVTPVLLGDVVALFAFDAGHRDLGPYVGALAGHGSAFFLA